jgi:hypothetical protein
MPTQTPSSDISRLLARAQGAQFNCWRALLSAEETDTVLFKTWMVDRQQLADIIFDLAEELKKCAK